MRGVRRLPKKNLHIHRNIFFILVAAIAISIIRKRPKMESILTPKSSFPAPLDCRNILRNGTDSDGV
ncbi:MAG: hypothetical protein A3G18_06635 [Rhodospirillales bacterium RIFCSPLOWO2_12_FULL_58_28]|nr:MAG: hypothetical protein A3H92_06330 [Rhodospirillales bacterium RIFCSPLOWO2_02_FULL_58_16]OHC79379.1 MAG: hypothetical protein A3G18_06635 [Rhodospirillales bacterium RIFCSPLOWO2_12_FULL_58_28]